MNTEKIAIIGASGFGREVKMLIDQMNIQNNRFEVIGFYDDNTSLPKKINGIPYLGEIDKVNEINFPCNVAIAIGDPTLKKTIISKITNPNIQFPNLIHPSTWISKDTVKLGKGNIICAGVIITTNITIDNFVIVNLCCTIGHDNNIKSYCSFMPSVNISGNVNINDAVYIGTGAKIINDLSIGSNTTIGAGAVVAKSLPENCVAVGIPAKPIKFKDI